MNIEKKLRDSFNSLGREYKISEKWEEHFAELFNELELAINLKNNFSINDAKMIIKAWENLPGPKRYTPKEIERWLNSEMSLVVNKIRTKYYENIKREEDYESARKAGRKLLNSGMFWEFYPNLSGNWEEDKFIITLFTF